MVIRMIGAGLTLLSGAGVALAVAREHARKEKALEELIRILDHLASDLKTNLSPLPMACMAAARIERGPISLVFASLSQNLLQQKHASAAACMHIALETATALPETALTRLKQLGDTLGQFDLDGQLRGIRTVQQLCRRDLEGLIMDRNTKVKSCQTLGFCTGAAIAILLL